MAKVFDISDYTPSYNESLFFDNNVWVYLFCPFANYHKSKQKDYSNFLKLAQQKKCAIYINSIVLSEFCNYWLQTEFKKWKKINPGKEDYKRDFIPSDEFKQSVHDVKRALNTILQIAVKNNDDFNAVNFDNILREFGNCDFNDSYYLELAQFKNWKIVTDDADLYKNNCSGVSVITANFNK